MTMLVPVEEVRDVVRNNLFLVYLNISTPSGIKQDKAAGQKTADDAGAVAKNAVRTSVNLHAGDTTLKAVQDFNQMTRQRLYSKTGVWDDAGNRALAVGQYIQFMQWFQDTKAEWQVLVDAAVAAYPVMISKQAFQLGLLFDEKKYMSVDQYAASFSMQLSVQPVPSSNHFMQQLEPTIIEQLKQSYDAAFDASMQNLKGYAITCMEEKLEHLYERIVSKQNDTKTRLHESLSFNGMQVAAVIKGFNVTNDPNLEMAMAAFGDLFLGLNVDKLKESTTYQDTILRELASVQVLIASV